MNLEELVAYHEDKVAGYDSVMNTTCDTFKWSHALKNRRFHIEASDLLRCMVRAQGGGKRWGR